MSIENPFDAIQQAVNQARELNRAADTQANNIANLLRGRMHHVSEWHLKALKRELRDFNIHTGRWKD